MKPTKRFGVLLFVFAVALLPAYSSQADPITPGFDLYYSGGSEADFSGPNQLPADFFGPGSLPFEGSVFLSGVPTGPGTTDTIIERLGGLPDGASGSIPIELVTLSLRSFEPIIVNYDSEPSRLWDVDVIVPPVPANPPQPSGGQMNVQHNDPTGGLFTVTLPIRPRFIFSEVGNPSNVQVLDLNDTWTMTSGETFIFPFGNFPISDPLWSHTPGVSDVHNGTYPAGGFYPEGRELFIITTSIFAEGDVLSSNLYPAVPLPVPEPGSLCLLVIGAPVVMRYRSR
jgi:hypothetical protein